MLLGRFSKQNPSVMSIKIYNKGMGGVVLVDQTAFAYYLDRKSSIRFYLRTFSDFMGIPYAKCFYCLQHASSFIVSYNIGIATHMISPRAEAELLPNTK